MHFLSVDHSSTSIFELFQQVVASLLLSDFVKRFILFSSHRWPIGVFNIEWWKFPIQIRNPTQNRRYICCQTIGLWNTPNCEYCYWCCFQLHLFVLFSCCSHEYHSLTFRLNKKCFRFQFLNQLYLELMTTSPPPPQQWKNNVFYCNIN